MTQDLIAEMTGGRAIYSTNNLTGALEKATETGGNYYTLSYSPADKNLDGRLRHIQIKMKVGGNYHLAYRRAYYASSTPGLSNTLDPSIAAAITHGAPELHQLIFGLHVSAAPNAVSKQQRFTLSYIVMAHQLRASGETPPEFEIAAAAYDMDGRMLSSTLNSAVRDKPSPDTANSVHNSYRMEQQLIAPLSTKFLRVAVRDAHTGRLGAMEIRLPFSLAQ
jgi:hypothetical protein